MSHKYSIPDTIQLYFRCANCGKYWEYPTYRASKYCNRKCTNAHYYIKRIKK